MVASSQDLLNVFVFVVVGFHDVKLQVWQSGIISVSGAAGITSGKCATAVHEIK